MNGVTRTAAMAALLLAAATPSAAQVPDQFRNLKVLPKDMGKDALVAIMRGYCDALGVRCTHCHVGEEGKPLTTYDFASDEKKPKQVARDMVKMVGTINGKSLAKIDTGHPDRRQVGCVTCHHGLARPEDVRETLLSTAEKDGVDAALAKYRELRDRYYGGDQYDFSPRALNFVSDRLADSDRFADAVKVQELNVELHPDTSSVFVALGRLHDRAGHRDQAIAAFRKAIELDPKNAWAAKQLHDLEAATSEPAKP